MARLLAPVLQACQSTTYWANGQKKHKENEESTKVKLLGRGRKRKELILKAVVHGSGT